MRLLICHAGLIFVCFFSALDSAVAAGNPLSISAGPALEIRGLYVNGTSVPLHGPGKVRLVSGPQTVAFSFGIAANPSRSLLRLRYKLDGFEDNWREVASDQSVSFRFIDTNQEPVAETVFRTAGETPGWTGSLDTSGFVHRRETVTAPPNARGLWVAVSSAGPPNAVGIYAVSNLVVRRINSSGQPSAALLSWGADAKGEMVGSEWLPSDWMRNGLRLGMARITQCGPGLGCKALTLLDSDPTAHAEWTTHKETAAPVAPGEQLLLEWDEACSVGLAAPAEVTYTDLPAGFYRFRLNELSLTGVPMEVEESLAFEVPLSFWRTPWAWALLSLLGLSAVAGAYRYVAWFQMRRKLASLESQRALEHERVRIARDIHDDLGARVTQISLVSGLAQSDSTLPEKARAEFGEISGMASELVASLYETVWAVNPENENLDALGNYICQMVDKLCDKAQLARRLRLAELPCDVQVPSHVRHNLVLAVKEAVHNVIKHASATELSVQVEWEGATLTIRIHDNGRGFAPSGRPAGNGLGNMRRRLEHAGGVCSLQSQPGVGTTVTLAARIQPGT
jgi:signal transduction histidine kinase